MSTSFKDLSSLKTEEDALDQSIALNRIVMAMLDAKRREDFWLRIILIVSILANVLIAVIFTSYESQWSSTKNGSVTQKTFMRSVPHT